MLQIRSIYFIAVFLFLSGIGYSQTITNEKAEKFGQILENAIATNDNFVAGVSAAVLVDGEELWKGAAGLSSIYNPQSHVTPDTLFQIYSITKTFTAALILDLMAENRLSLSDEIQDWISVQGNENIDSTASIKQLITHTTGFDDYVTNESFLLTVYFQQSKIWQPYELLHYVETPLFEPGTDYAYSSTNYIILGMIAEEVTDSTIARLFRTRYFDPLELNNTYFPLAENIPTNIANPHDNLSTLGLTNSGTVDLLEVLDTFDGIISSAWATGAIVSSAEDIAKWGHALFAGEAIHAKAHDSLIAIISAPGFSSHYQDIAPDAVGHNGSAVGFISTLVYVPSENVSICVLINQGHTTMSGELSEISEALYDALLEPSAIETFAAQSNHYKLFPNPCQNFIHVNIPQSLKNNTNISIYSSSGKRLRTFCLKKGQQNPYEIPVSGLAGGVYFFHINNEEQIIKPFVIKR